MLIKICGSFEWFGRCCGRCADLESAGVYPDCGLIADHMDGFRGTIALLSHRRFLSGRDENGIRNKCEQIRRGPSGQWGQFCFLSCAFNYLLGPMGRSRYGESFAWQWRRNNYILLTVRAKSSNWYCEHEVSASFRSWLL